MVPAPLKFFMKGDIYMSQYVYDDKSYYKLIVDAKTKETQKVPLGSVPYLESLKTGCGHWHRLLLSAY